MWVRLDVAICRSVRTRPLTDWNVAGNKRSLMPDGIYRSGDIAVNFSRYLR